ncbi:Uu.00g022450.m01.CDS01 [Anthostomella pinea]|uniref:Phospholipase n=1 Tax=Anthostomella pinea TaxID=933095 RepID=A0AAI8VU06_9PEZI|nr:Uu.00g022450.m01.CDS01 [Anthostomella pinea]
MDFFRKAESALKEALGGDEEERPPRNDDEGGRYEEQEQQQQQQHYDQPSGPKIKPVNTDHRFQSFSPETSGNVKWYVDGASYFWAVSMALEQARESVYILDWWLSPELYLRRPPSRNEQYRLDNMLRAAAERGVQVRIIVYKEVTQALTLDSAHTKHALEALHPNIQVFRHPDHVPTDVSRLEQAFEGLSLDKLKLDTFSLSKVSGDALKELYGSFGDTVLYWAHHEKLCVVDRRIVFMGGLDMCFGRYDTNSHPIADAHPGDVSNIIFPGQDFNNARAYDFEGVDNWDHNQLDRTKSSRMGWSDIALSMNGPIVSSLLEHFSDRWNFIWDDKYTNRDDGKYQRISAGGSTEPSGDEGRRHHFDDMQGHLNRGLQRFMGDGGDERARDEGDRGQYGGSGGLKIQLCRSACEWSSGHPTEHSIFNAYVNAIESAEHFVYIENQFFITATSDEQHPVKNKIGASIVSRIVRAYQNGEEFRVIVLMPAVPAFAGDLHSEGALGTRAIMEFQYNSISRGGHSIIESLQQQGVEDWQRYIGFYNLRNYDRINISSTMGQAEQESGVAYDDARRQYEDMVGGGEGDGGGSRDQYDRYQNATSNVSDQTWDTVSSCYMEGGPDLRNVPWQGSEEAEMNAFVSEELYIHTKVLIADDRLVICGSANLNDRSQLGDHDSEIAVVIEDPETVESSMNGQPYAASRFATSLRRQVFRKHLGLLPDQRWDQPTANWTPIDQDPQEYDWGSESDRLVEDPLSEQFWSLWQDTARDNTSIFSKVFHPVPNDAVRDWDQYEDFFSRHFIIPGKEMSDEEKEGKVDYGHVVPEEFRDGGVAEVKDWLSRVRGTLVEMPLDFLIDVKDIAKEGLSLNAFTDEIYT